MQIIDELFVTPTEILSSVISSGERKKVLLETETLNGYVDSTYIDKKMGRKLCIKMDRKLCIVINLIFGKARSYGYIIVIK